MSVVLPAPKNPVTIVNGVFAEPSGASEEEAIAVDGVARASASASASLLRDDFVAVSSFVAVFNAVYRSAGVELERLDGADITYHA